MLLDFEEHMFHRRIMQEAFVRTRLVGYTEQVDKVVSQVVANDWVPPNDPPRFLLYPPAMKQMTLDIASMVFMGTSRAATTSWSPRSTMPSPRPSAPATRSSAPASRPSPGGAACRRASCWRTTSRSV